MLLLKATAQAFRSADAADADSNIPISRGIPAITVSRGGLGDGGHSPDEWWLNQDGHVAMQIALLILVAEAGLIN